MNFHNGAFLRLGVAKLSSQRIGDTRWHELVDFATEHRDLFDQPRTEVGVLFDRSEEDRFEIGLQLSVHQRHLEFELKVANGPQPTDDGGCLLVAGKLDEKTIELGN